MMYRKCAWLALWCSCLVFVAAAGRREPVQPDPRVVELSRRTGYSPVVPFPAESIVDPSAKPPSWLEVRPFPVVDGQPIVFRKTFHSESLGIDVGYNIFLPPGYEDDQAKRFPVIYWLHGRNDNEYTNIGLALYAHDAIVQERLEPIIIVFVNGLGQSFYLDSVDGRYPAETLLIKELVPQVDASYRTLATRRGRHIAGMSMGGFGCLRLAFKYPDLFSSVVSYAGVFPDEAGSKEPNVLKITGGDRSLYLAQTPRALVEANADRIRDHLAIRVVCGSQDRFVSSAREFNERLARLNIDHDYEELSPLGHDIEGMFARSAVEGLQFALEGGKRVTQQSVKFDVNTNVPIRVIRVVDPSYPETAKQARAEGRVILEATIGMDGAIKEVRTISGDPRLADPTREVVRQWRFEPPKVNGQPAEVTIGVDVKFRLGE